MNSTAFNLLLVATGGAAGSITRYLLSVGSSRLQLIGLPAGTFIANFLGCLCAGVLLTYLERRAPYKEELQLLLLVGFCGGFTTFSAFAVENLKMLNRGEYTLAFGYILLSLVVGLFGVWVGTKVLH